MTDKLPEWPALRAYQDPLPDALQYHRGVFGKVHGARSDFRWIAQSEGFKRGAELERGLYMGSQDQACGFSFWRNLPTLDDRPCYFAGAAYPSRAQDATGRSGFLEKQIAELDNPGLPAALAALLLLPLLRQWDDGIWWDRREEQNWLQPDAILAIAAQDCASRLGSVNLEDAVKKGVEGLRGAGVDKEALAHFYADLLAGEKPAALYATAPLAPETLAVLLLPLSRQKADTVSIAGWIPSSRYQVGELARCWDAIVLPRPKTNQALLPHQEISPKATRMAQALLGNRLGDIADLWEQEESHAGKRLPYDTSASPLAIWGASASGKTVLMAQLYLDYHDKVGEWQIVANAVSEQFTRLMLKYRSENSFPLATVSSGDYSDQLQYDFFNRRTQLKAIVSTEDRSGHLYERAHDEQKDERGHEQSKSVLKHLKNAAGLILLVDPHRENWMSTNDLEKLFRHMQAERHGQHPLDPRPIAVCISKVDDLIENPADWRYAIDEPHEFVKSRDDWNLVKLCEQYCANYQFFPVSAVGIELFYGIGESNTFYDENLNPRVKSGGKSLNLIAPFIWIIDELQAQRP